ncbi:hypothetical protein Sliba_00010 [Streptomyces nigrescens]|uniref:Uncharacterized protein n=4 Tax=Streptomyces TaxID=1883 RepID=A0A640T8B1_STRNI|nr:hypothetical protein DKG71_01680 [Streptomyces sp. NEAU-S7GS2]GFE19548.1 hypothetical protein Sliba_00010 [Streptomyces libani subsp. libani]GGW08389.1 hypothetical protein GCM10010500_79190 [Streptomyces libani subsp. libani]GHB29962.1 hypothetical protein GCM10010392_67760 [Streptomyces clavifer]
MERDANLMELLHRLDDPECPETPADYNAADAAASFSRLAVQVGSRFSTPCGIDRDIQDSAQYGRIEVPGEATVCGTRIVALVSKFKPLAMVAADNPGAFLGTDEAQAEGELDANDLEKVEQVLAESGYITIPEELLERSYGGPTLLRFHGSGEPSWWDRFFGSF